MPLPALPFWHFLGAAIVFLFSAMSHLTRAIEETIATTRSLSALEEPLADIPSVPEGADPSEYETIAYPFAEAAAEGAGPDDTVITVQGMDPGIMNAELPFTLGHEPVGVVEAIGTGVTGLEVGQRVELRSAIRINPRRHIVSQRGDLWRWDGFSVAANAPTGAARRLAG